MIPFILLILGFVLVAVGAIADLRWREVPDWSNYFGIAAALLIRGLYSINAGSWTWILEGLIGLGAMYLVACGLFYLGQWGGGDSKLLMALGAIFGLGFSGQGMLGSFLVNLVLFGGIWGGFWSVKLAFQHRPAVSKAFYALMKKEGVLRARITLFSVAVLLLGTAFAFSAYTLRFSLIVLAVTLLLTFYTWGFAKSVEKACFIKTVPVSQLEEGDWILHNVKVKGKRICGPADLGVSRAQITALKRAGIKTVTIKEGVPFVPGFLFAYIATMAWGNVFVALARAVSGI